MRFWGQTAASRGSHSVVCGEMCLCEAGVSSVTETVGHQSKYHQTSVDDLGCFLRRAFPVDTGFAISSLLRLTIGRRRVAPDIFRAHVPLHLNIEFRRARDADADIHRVIREVWPSLDPLQRLFGFFRVLHYCA